MINLISSSVITKEVASLTWKEEESFHVVLFLMFWNFLMVYDNKVIKIKNKQFKLGNIKGTGLEKKETERGKWV